MNYGMFTENGNRVIDGVVIAAKQLNWSPEEVIDILKDISTVRGLHEAYDTAVVEYVYEAIFEETV